MLRLAQNIVFLGLLTTALVGITHSFMPSSRIIQVRSATIDGGMIRHISDLSMAKKKKNSTNGSGGGGDGDGDTAPSVGVVATPAAPVAEAPVDGAKENIQLPAPTKAAVVKEEVTSPPAPAPPAPPSKKDAFGLKSYPLSAADAAKASAKYGAIQDTGEKAFAILVDLGLVELHG